MADRVSTAGKSMDAGSKVLNCSNCKVELHAIKVIDKHLGKHTTLEYTTADSKRSWLSGEYRSTGSVSGYICPTCGAISFFGEPLR